MGTEPPAAASDGVSPPAEEVMPHQPDEDAGIAPEVDSAISDLLSAQPGLPMPPPVRDRILGALRGEAATRDALLGNDADPTEGVDLFGKQARPVRDHEELS